MASYSPKKEELARLGELAVQRARTWVNASTNYPTNYAAKLLADVLHDEGGLDFTVAFVDEIIRPEDLRVAAKSLNRLTRKAPMFLPWYLRYPAMIGGSLAPLMPSVVIPIARKIFAMLVGDLVLDVSDSKLGPAIAKLKADGARLNMNLLGEAVLGDTEAAKRLSDTMNLLRRDDVDYVSLKVSAVTGPHNPWSFDAIAAGAVENLLPVYRLAANSPSKKFINLDMEEYKDLHLTIKVFKEILDRPEFLDLEAGIVLQAYLPDALDAMIDLQKWAKARVKRGGAPIKVRVVKGANLAMETVDALMHGWPLTTEPSKAHSDAQYIAVLDYSLREEHLKNVRIGVAGMNIFTVGVAYEMAESRGLSHLGAIDYEMLAGMATTMAQAVSEDIGAMLYYVPVVRPEEYDVAIAYLVRRLEENAAPENFMSAVFDIADDERLLKREQDRFMQALELVGSQPVTPMRTQDRTKETRESLTALMKDEDGSWVFRATPDSDPALPANLRWAADIASRVEKSALGNDLVAASTLTTEKEVDQVIATAKEAASSWAGLSGAERADILHKAGVNLALRRAELIEVAASECGKAVDQTDVEVSEAIDFAHFYAQSAIKLAEVPGARFVPDDVVLITPPWNFPVAIPAGSTIAALAAGASTILKPASQAKRCSALLAECLWDAGVPKDVLHYVVVPDRDLGRALVSDERIDKVVLTGGIETAQMFKSWRPELEIMAETSGKNSLIVTPSADLDLAVKDLVASAFGHAGQKCSAASLVILVGSVGTSRRFHGQLIDAVESLNIGYPSDLAVQMGPINEPAKGKLLRGLTTLSEGEKWAIRPRSLDKSGKLWSPGVRSGVQPGSEYHLTEYFGPILGVIRCDTLEEAVAIQNQVDYGLTGGIHSLDPEEINYWLEHVEVGNAYVNRGITGAIVQRQPFGGWKRSVVGNGTKAGGPSYLFGFGRWENDLVSALTDSGGVAPSLTSSLARSVLEAAQDAEISEAEKDALKLALGLDARAWDEEYGILRDVSQLGVERNVFRYLPTPVLIRVGEEAKPWEVLRVVAAGLQTGAPIRVSSAVPLLPAISAFLDAQGVDYRVMPDEQWLDRGAVTWADRAGLDGRIRLIGSSYTGLAAALGDQVDVAVWHGPVTASGRVEMLPFLHEQAVAITNHRFGDPTSLTKTVMAGIA
ncbi:MAG: bifunctional proline dehydrogenase/L-glutamate gamma-semialdehyde dehydrogenase [Actinomycetaceae bacterium]|nr:bifunctional proline dehydrogenase/L-glutamate gamma-semialdehyde dehydrogenase [Actinomycetaceae bacterium]